ncbi:MAG: GNAT family N-acetyltransferase [Bacteroidota bacterium]
MDRSAKLEISSGHRNSAILSPEEFIRISQANGWGLHREYNLGKVEKALSQTQLIVCIRNEAGNLLGCARALTDELFFTTIPDIFVHPDYQGRGYGRMLMEVIKEKLGHTSIFFGAQPGNEAFFEKMGFEKGLQSYQFKKRG